MNAQFGIVWGARGLLIDGFFTTLWLCVLATVASLAAGAVVAAALMSPNRAVAGTAGVLVDTMRCVPFLLFAYIIYYGLPSIGLSFGNWSSGLFALVAYNTAYMAELLRAAWRSLPAETVEAGHAFGFAGFNLVRRIILPPVVFAAVPTIGNQVIQIIKDSAFLTIIAVEELTHAAVAIQATYFLPFAAFISALLLYWVLCLGVEQLVGFVGARAELRR